MVLLNIKTTLNAIFSKMFGLLRFLMISCDISLVLLNLSYFYLVRTIKKFTRIHIYDSVSKDLLMGEYCVSIN